MLTKAVLLGLTIVISQIDADTSKESSKYLKLLNDVVKNLNLTNSKTNYFKVKRILKPHDYILSYSGSGDLQGLLNATPLENKSKHLRTHVNDSALGVNEELIADSSGTKYGIPHDNIKALSTSNAELLDLYSNANLYVKTDSKSGTGDSNEKTILSQNIGDLSLSDLSKHQNLLNIISNIYANKQLLRSKNHETNNYKDINNNLVKFLKKIQNNEIAFPTFVTKSDERHEFSHNNVNVKQSAINSYLDELIHNDSDLFTKFNPLRNNNQNNKTFHHKSVLNHDSLINSANSSRIVNSDLKNDKIKVVAFDKNNFNEHRQPSNNAIDLKVKHSQNHDDDDDKPTKFLLNSAKNNMYPASEKGNIPFVTASYAILNMQVPNAGNINANKMYTDYHTGDIIKVVAVSSNKSNLNAHRQPSNNTIYFEEKNSQNHDNENDSNFQLKSANNNVHLALEKGNISGVTTTGAILNNVVPDTNNSKANKSIIDYKNETQSEWIDLLQNETSHESIVTQGENLNFAPEVERTKEDENLKVQYEFLTKNSFKTFTKDQVEYALEIMKKILQKKFKDYVIDNEALNNTINSYNFVYPNIKRNEEHLSEVNQNKGILNKIDDDSFSYNKDIHKNQQLNNLLEFLESDNSTFASNYLSSSQNSPNSDNGKKLAKYINSENIANREIIDNLYKMFALQYQGKDKSDSKLNPLSLKSDYKLPNLRNKKNYSTLNPLFGYQNNSKKLLSIFNKQDTQKQTAQKYSQGDNMLILNPYHNMKNVNTMAYNQKVGKNINSVWDLVKGFIHFSKSSTAKPNISTEFTNAEDLTTSRPTKSSSITQFSTTVDPEISTQHSKNNNMESDIDYDSKSNSVSVRVLEVNLALNSLVQIIKDKIKNKNISKENLLRRATNIILNRNPDNLTIMRLKREITQKYNTEKNIQHVKDETNSVDNKEITDYFKTSSAPYLPRSENNSTRNNLNAERIDSEDNPSKRRSSAITIDNNGKENIHKPYLNARRNVPSYSQLDKKQLLTIFNKISNLGNDSHNITNTLNSINLNNLFSSNNQGALNFSDLLKKQKVNKIPDLGGFYNYLRDVFLPKPLTVNPVIPHETTTAEDISYVITLPKITTSTETSTTDSASTSTLHYVIREPEKFNDSLSKNNNTFDFNYESNKNKAVSVRVLEVNLALDSLAHAIKEKLIKESLSKLNQLRGATNKYVEINPDSQTVMRIKREIVQNNHNENKLSTKMDASSMNHSYPNSVSDLSELSREDKIYINEIKNTEKSETTNFGTYRSKRETPNAEEIVNNILERSIYTLNQKNLYEPKYGFQQDNEQFPKNNKFTNVRKNWFYNKKSTYANSMSSLINQSNEIDTINRSSLLRGQTERTSEQEPNIGFSKAHDNLILQNIKTNSNGSKLSALWDYIKDIISLKPFNVSEVTSTQAKTTEYMTSPTTTSTATNAPIIIEASTTDSPSTSQSYIIQEPEIYPIVKNDIHFDVDYDPKKNSVSVSVLEINIALDSLAKLIKDEIQKEEKQNDHKLLLRSTDKIFRHKREIHKTDQSPTANSFKVYTSSKFVKREISSAEDVALAKKIREKIRQSKDKEDFSDRLLPIDAIKPEEPTRRQLNDNDAIKDSNSKNGHIKYKILAFIDEIVSEIKEKVGSVQKLEQYYRSDKGFKVGYAVSNMKQLYESLIHLYKEVEKNKNDWDELTILNVYDQLKNSNKRVTDLLTYLIHLIRRNGINTSDNFGSNDRIAMAYYDEEQ